MTPSVIDTRPIDSSTADKRINYHDCKFLQTCCTVKGIRTLEISNFIGTDLSFRTPSLKEAFKTKNYENKFTIPRIIDVVHVIRKTAKNTTNKTGKICLKIKDYVLSLKDSDFPKSNLFTALRVCLEFLNSKSNGSNPQVGNTVSSNESKIQQDNRIAKYSALSTFNKKWADKSEQIKKEFIQKISNDLKINPSQDTIALDSDRIIAGLILDNCDEITKHFEINSPKTPIEKRIFKIAKEESEPIRNVFIRKISNIFNINLSQNNAHLDSDRIISRLISDNYEQIIEYFETNSPLTSVEKRVFREAKEVAEKIKKEEEFNLKLINFFDLNSSEDTISLESESIVSEWILNDCDLIFKYFENKPPNSPVEQRVYNGAKEAYDKKNKERNLIPKYFESKYLESKFPNSPIEKEILNEATESAFIRNYIKNIFFLKNSMSHFPERLASKDLFSILEMPPCPDIFTEEFSDRDYLNIILWAFTTIRSEWFKKYLDDKFVDSLNNLDEELQEYIECESEFILKGVSSEFIRALAQLELVFTEHRAFQLLCSYVLPNAYTEKYTEQLAGAFKANPVDVEQWHFFKKAISAKDADLLCKAIRGNKTILAAVANDIDIWEDLSDSDSAIANQVIHELEMPSEASKRSATEAELDNKETESTKKVRIDEA